MEESNEDHHPRSKDKRKGIKKTANELYEEKKRKTSLFLPNEDVGGFAFGSHDDDFPIQNNVTALFSPIAQTGTFSNFIESTSSDRQASNLERNSVEIRENKPSFSTFVMFKPYNVRQGRLPKKANLLGFHIVG